MSFHCLQAYIVSTEKSEVNHIVVPLCVMNHFVPVAFTIFSLALVFSRLSIMCLGVYLFGLILLGVLWISLISILNAFHQIWGILVIISLNTFCLFISPSSPSGTTIICILVYLMLSCWFLQLCSFFFCFFFSLIFRLENSYWPIFKHIGSSAISNLLLSPWNKFFILIIILFNSKISICCFF